MIHDLPICFCNNCDSTNLVTNGKYERKRAKKMVDSSVSNSTSQALNASNSWPQQQQIGGDSATAPTIVTATTTNNNTNDKEHQQQQRPPFLRRVSVSDPHLDLPRLFATLPPHHIVNAATAGEKNGGWWWGCPTPSAGINCS